MSIERIANEVEPAIKRLKLDGENFYLISNYDEIPPFFMSVVSDSHHWMFISSNGALSAGRKNSEYALFPYYTVDKITESYDTTGSKTIVQIPREGQIYIWEPFSERNQGRFKTSRNIYKNAIGNKIIFEELNIDLELGFRYEWNTSDKYGFVRKSTLINTGGKAQEVNIVDGIQNIMPDGVNSDLQNAASNLVDAYKRNELDATSGLGIYALSAIIVDKAEPSEALKSKYCLVCWFRKCNLPSFIFTT
jgi:hypothetical protein